LAGQLQVPAGTSQSVLLKQFKAFSSPITHLSADRSTDFILVQLIKAYSALGRLFSRFHQSLVRTPTLSFLLNNKQTNKKLALTDGTLVRRSVKSV